ncbi:MAG TPA: hypothetical protein DCL08_06440 [Anaerolineaceae bacterium]|nr:hypothetical protein [Anaerolineaceae bacterium]
MIIFDPATPLEQMRKFIEEAGFPQDNRSIKEEKVNGKWNFDEACVKASEIGAITIAAHVDSNKGIFNDLPKGEARASAFTQKNLYGMQFKSPKVRDQIISILKNPEYERENELAFIRASDFHGADDENFGAIKSWIRFDSQKMQFSKKFIFSEIKEALRNPLERVADGPPKIIEIKKQLEMEVSVESLINEEDQSLFLKYICAFANTSDRTIVIGRDNYGTWKGIKFASKSEMEEKIRLLIEENIFPVPNTDTLIYQNYEDSFFATIRVFKGNSVFAIRSEDRAYILKNDKPFTATIDIVSRLAEANFLKKYRKYSITDYLRTNIRKLEGVSDTIDILSVVRSIEANSVTIKSLLFKYDEISLKFDETPEEFYSCPNGYSNGNVIFTTPNMPRLEDSYLRLSAPVFRLSLVDHENENEKLSGEKLIIVPRGGVYYDNNDDIFIFGETYPPIVLSKSEDYDGPDFKYLLAYLKSSLAIWYADRCLGNYDFRLFRVFRDMIIPKPYNKDIEFTIIEYVNRLLQMEEQFLDECNPIHDLTDVEERVNKHLEKSKTHNLKANKIMSEIDNLFFEMLKIDDDDRIMIKQRIKVLGLFDF